MADPDKPNVLVIWGDDIGSLVRGRLVPPLRPAAQRPKMIDTGMSHIGVRCIRRV
ncbi:MAG TPA: hypothetical protein VH063_02155 [Gaiellaceae bacterium]|jgi:hypothetical protein|nr:hypothetical protein [Gaiellaceae bacterium]